MTTSTFLDEALGPKTIRTLTSHPKHSGVQLVIMLDQLQGEAERTLGTGGAVCAKRNRTRVPARAVSVGAL
jgi:hypothetical protein